MIECHCGKCERLLKELEVLQAFHALTLSQRDLAFKQVEQLRQALNDVMKYVDPYDKQGEEVEEAALKALEETV